jgi:hypothetical protein
MFNMHEALGGTQIWALTWLNGFSFMFGRKAFHQVAGSHLLSLCGQKC